MNLLIISLDAKMYYSGLGINEARLKLYIGISLDVATRLFLFTVFIVFYDTVQLYKCYIYQC